VICDILCDMVDVVAAIAYVMQLLYICIVCSIGMQKQKKEAVFTSLPCVAMTIALGKEGEPRNWPFAKCVVFAECNGLGTRQRISLCRVSLIWHSANMMSLPSARRWAHDKMVF
jgi:hypothetical protein